MERIGTTMSHPVVILKGDIPKPWWSGDKRVEPYMVKINEAIKSSGLKGQLSIDIYNRAYEAIYQVIKDYELIIERTKNGKLI